MQSSLMVGKRGKGGKCLVSQFNARAKPIFVIKNPYLLRRFGGVGGGGGGAGLILLLKPVLCQS